MADDGVVVVVLDLAICKSDGSVHFHRGVASASVNAPLSMNADVPRNLRLGKSMTAIIGASGEASLRLCVEYCDALLGCSVIRFER